MVEFIKTISQSEINSTYLNMTDDSGQRYGSQVGLEHRQKLVVVDGHGRKTYAQIHHDNQIWGALRNWFNDNGIQAGDRIRFRYKEGEREEGLPVVHLELLEHSSKNKTLDEEEDEARKPLLIPISLEKQLEEFLVANPSLIEPGLSLYVDEDGKRGSQYPTDVGTIDLLCQRADGSLLVVELKRGRVSDVVVGQVSRYIGWVKKHIAGNRQVGGLILTPERDDNLKYAVLANPNLALRYFKIRLEFVDEGEL